MKTLYGTLAAMALPFMAMAQAETPAKADPLAAQQAEITQAFKAQENSVNMQMQELNKAYEMEKKRLSDLQGVLADERNTELDRLKTQAQIREELDKKRQAYEAEVKRLNEQMRKAEADWTKDKGELDARQDKSRQAYEAKMGELSKKREALENQPQPIDYGDVAAVEVVEESVVVYSGAAKCSPCTGQKIEANREIIRDSINLRQQMRKF